MKKYEVSTSYTLEIKAKNEGEAKELFIEILDTIDPNWIEDCIEVKKIK